VGLISCSCGTYTKTLEEVCHRKGGVRSGGERSVRVQERVRRAA